jgi:branched-chain amino acid transport system ATP-binding protein
MMLLEVAALRVAYGDIPAVRDVSFAVEEGDIFVLLGANGAGKTTTLRAISGLVPAAGGTVRGLGRNLLGLRPNQVARAGIAHVPEGRRVFTHLSVEDNLAVGFIARGTARMPGTRDAIYALFPRLADRRRQAAGTLSGGEQQMLAIGRALMNGPKLLMLDEPSLGLSPVMTDLVMERLQEISRTGLAILLVEQNAAALELATRGAVLANGVVALAGDRAALTGSDFVRQAYLGA